MAVDPGIGGTGIVVLGAGLTIGGAKVLNASRKLPWWERAQVIARQVAEISEDCKAKYVFCECPQFFQSAGGEMVAGRGDLVKLSMAAGAVAGILANIPLAFFPIEVNIWKGQLAKPVVMRRLLRIIGVHQCAQLHSHEWDACGIGMFAKGRFE